MRVIVASTLVLLVAVAAVLIFWLITRLPPEPVELPTNTDTPLISGSVREGTSPIAGASVRIQASTESVLTDAKGRFQLTPRAERSDRVTAWKEGYLIGSGRAGDLPLDIQLTRLPPRDNEEYTWVDPTPDSKHPQNCGNCHGEIYREWSASGHARSVSNRRFRNLFDGSDWQGRPNVGWNLLAEHPDGAGVCASCHAPTLTSFNDDPRQARGVAAQGVHCDYCHKIADVGSGTPGLTHGRFNLTLLRPTEGQLFFGPLDDVDRHEDSYSPLYKDSRYCASCHEGIVFGVHVYSTYSEWLASPARRDGKQCQTCHMTPTGRLTNIAPGKGGIERDPQTLGNHRFFATSQEEMLRRAVKVETRQTRTADGVRVEVVVTAHDAGHRVPTGFVDRHLILVVEATDGAGLPVLATDGPRLPNAVGPDAGKLGKLYAKLLVDSDGHGPAPFWRAGVRAVDSRLTPGEADRLDYRFPPAAKEVRVRLVHRKFWQGVARVKGWPEEEITIVDRVARDES